MKQYESTSPIIYKLKTFKSNKTKIAKYEKREEKKKNVSVDEEITAG